MSEGNITVYGSPQCVQCTATTKSMERHGISFSYVDVSTDLEARSFVTDKLGYSQVPVVVVGDKHWAGFQPDRIKGLAAHRGEDLQ